MNAESLIRQLELDSLERLKWFVLQHFRVLPGSAAAQELSDQDYVICGAHMVIDNRQRSSVYQDETCVNTSFDENRYSNLSEEIYEF